MTQDIKTICLRLPLRIGSVNCYLIKTDTSYILIDSGYKNGRAVLEKELDQAGCKPGNLKLVILTHGDFDHTSNAAYLRNKFGAKISMHYDDSGMVEHGDMFWNRKKPNRLMKIIFDLVFGMKESDRFKPDVSVEDGQDLSEYGYDAKVIFIPGHSKGSIGILTASGDLFCGDLLVNTDKPVLNSMLEDPDSASASVNKLKSMAINTVFPGHGRPFQMKQFINPIP